MRDFSIFGTMLLWDSSKSESSKQDNVEYEQLKAPDESTQLKKKREADNQNLDILLEDRMLDRDALAEGAWTSRVGGRCW